MFDNEIHFGRDKNLKSFCLALKVNESNKEKWDKMLFISGLQYIYYDDENDISQILKIFNMEKIWFVIEVNTVKDFEKSLKLYSDIEGRNIDKNVKECKELIKNGLCLDEE